MWTPEFGEAIEVVGRAVDAAGVGVMVIGAMLAGGAFVLNFRHEEAYRLVRLRLGRAILLGLELLVAADIIKTVAIAPNFTNVGVLALIVLIRTFLSFTLQLEIEGKWPWQGHGRP